MDLAYGCPKGGKGRLRFHPDLLTQCEGNGLKFDEALRNYSFTAERPTWNLANRKKVICVHLMPDSEQPPTQEGNSTTEGLCSRVKTTTSVPVLLVRTEAVVKAKKRRRKSLTTRPRKSQNEPVLERTEEEDDVSEEEWNGDAADESDGASESEDANEQDDANDMELCDLEFEELDGTRHIRVGKLKTEKKFRRPADGEAFGLRRIVVALVWKERGRWTLEFVAIDSWVVNGSRVGDYPSADPCKPSTKDRRFTPDPYWKEAHSANKLRDEVLEYVKKHKTDTFLGDNDSEISDYSQQSSSTTEPPEAPKNPITAPLCPRHSSSSVTADFGSSAGSVDLPNTERVHAVVCFANALGESSTTSLDSSLHTYRNFQISMAGDQDLREFRAFIRNVKTHDTRGNLKQILRKRTYRWWGNFQVWVMPLHSANGQVGDAEAYCWDDANHNDLFIQDFLHPTDQARVGRAELFIEIRIVVDPKYQRKERAWVRHKGYREGRTHWFGWKEKSKNNGRCILDDEEDKGQIRKDTMAKTLPPYKLLE
ncbi:hypothetical protein MRB53_041271 [Persea americana]|nr:hypothetical protein MRB53_041271 [Persea americana]